MARKWLVSRPTLASLVATVLLVAVVLTDAAAQSQSRKVYSKYKGQMIVSDVEVSVSDDDSTMQKNITSSARQEVKRPEGSNEWHFYFMAFLKTKPASGQLSVAFYDPAKKGQMVTYKDIGVDTSSIILASDLAITEDDGLNPGTKYEIAVGDLSGSKPNILARSKAILFK